jgi:hypothetical protein
MCASLVNPYFGLREALHQRAARAGVVEVDVGQRQHPRRVGLEHRKQPVEAAAGTGIDDDLADTPGADDLGAPQVKQVDELGLGCGRLGHGRGRCRRSSRGGDA